MIRSDRSAHPHELHTSPMTDQIGQLGSFHGSASLPAREGDGRELRCRRELLEVSHRAPVMHQREGFRSERSAHLIELHDWPPTRQTDRGDQMGSPESLRPRSVASHELSDWWLEVRARRRHSSPMQCWHPKFNATPTPNRQTMLPGSTELLWRICDTRRDHGFIE